MTDTRNYLTALICAATFSFAPPLLADNKEKIDANMERALTWLHASDKDSKKLLKRAAGVLVFPDIVEMGFGIGGEFGEGALLIDGEAVDYYATAGSQFGMGPESEFKAEVIFFMTEEALENFRQNLSWKVGDHATVPMVFSGAEALKSRDAHVGMVLSEDGVITHIDLKGDKITRIVR